jgi:hypothetical protein
MIDDTVFLADFAQDLGPEVSIVYCQPGLTVFRFDPNSALAQTTLVDVLSEWAARHGIDDTLFGLGWDDAGPRMESELRRVGLLSNFAGRRQSGEPKAADSKSRLSRLLPRALKSMEVGLNLVKKVSLKLGLSRADYSKEGRQPALTWDFSDASSVLIAVCIGKKIHRVFLVAPEVSCLRSGQRRIYGNVICGIDDASLHDHAVLAVLRELYRCYHELHLLLLGDKETVLSRLSHWLPDEVVHRLTIRTPVLRPFWARFPTQAVSIVEISFEERAVSLNSLADELGGDDLQVSGRLPGLVLLSIEPGSDLGEALRFRLLQLSAILGPGKLTAWIQEEELQEESDDDPVPELLQVREYCVNDLAGEAIGSFVCGRDLKILDGVRVEGEFQTEDALWILGLEYLHHRTMMMRSVLYQIVQRRNRKHLLLLFPVSLKPGLTREVFVADIQSYLSVLGDRARLVASLFAAPATDNEKARSSEETISTIEARPPEVVVFRLDFDED